MDTYRENSNCVTISSVSRRLRDTIYFPYQMAGGGGGWRRPRLPPFEVVVIYRRGDREMINSIVVVTRAIIADRVAVE